MSTDYIVSGSDLLSVANSIREKAGISDSLAFPNGFTEAIAAIEAGGQNIFTFTPAAVGNTTIEIEVPPDTTAIVWYKIDKEADVSSGEGVYGATYIREYKSSGSQYLSVLYLTVNGVVTSPSIYGVSLSINNLGASSSSYYGGAIGVWNTSKKMINKISFYANNAGAKGLRVGATYAVVLI